MDAYTPPPSPSPSSRIPHVQRDRPCSRRTASPRLKIRRRSFTERPSTPTPRPSSPELIFSMSPVDSHLPAVAPKTQLNPGALLARARQQSAGLVSRPRPRTPLLYSFPQTKTLAVAVTTTTTRGTRVRCSPITESSDDTDALPTHTHIRSAPIAIPLPIAPASDADSAQHSSSFYSTSDAEDDKGKAARPRKIVGFDTGTDSEVEDCQSEEGGPLRLEPDPVPARRR